MAADTGVWLGVVAAAVMAAIAKKEAADRVRTVVRARMFFIVPVICAQVSGWRLDAVPVAVDAGCSAVGVSAQVDVYVVSVAQAVGDVHRGFDS